MTALTGFSIRRGEREYSVNVVYEIEYGEVNIKSATTENGKAFIMSPEEMAMIRQLIISKAIGRALEDHMTKKQQEEKL
jgi:hypothetical protein